MTKSEIQAEALYRARHHASMANYPAIFEGFMARGFSEDDIRPRENILTYHAWRAVGRQVRKGEKGVQVVTWITRTKKADTGDDNGESYRRPKRATVFHVSQTDEA